VNLQGSNFDTSEEYDVVVIGAGIIGSMVARELSKYEGRIGLIEKEVFPGFGVSKCSLSMVHSPDFCPSGTLKGKLCVNAPHRFKSLSEELGVTFKEVDELWLALPPSQISNLEEAKRRGEEHGGTGFEIIGPDKIRELEPNVNPKAVAALYVRGLGVLHPPEWAFALAENAVQNGVHLYLNRAVLRICRDNNSNYLIQTSKGAFRTRFIVNAAGLFTDEVASMVGDDDIKLILTKGTMAVFDKSVSYLIRHMVYGTFSNKHSQVITPTAHGNLILGLGFFTTPENKGDTRVTYQGLQDILEMGRELIPSLSEKDIITSFAGIRSENNKVPDGDFYIAHSKYSPGVIHAVIGSPGVTAAPAITDLVIKMLSEAGLLLEPKNSFKKKRTSWPRLSEASLSEKEVLVKSNPKYGHVICRCETVSEAEVIEAIRRGATTLDGIKHLTRAGMGRCQGGFCGSRVVQLLSKALKLSPLDVTKKGEGSREFLYGTKELIERYLN